MYLVKQLNTIQLSLRPANQWSFHLWWVFSDRALKCHRSTVERKNILKGSKIVSKLRAKRHFAALNLKPIFALTLSFCITLSSFSFSLSYYLLSLSLCVSLFLLFLSFSLFVEVFLSFFLSLCITLSFFLSLSLFVSLFPPSLSLSLSLFPSFLLSLCIAISLSLSFSLCGTLSFCFSLYVSVFPYFSLFASFIPSFSISLVSFFLLSRLSTFSSRSHAAYLCVNVNPFTYVPAVLFLIVFVAFISFSFSLLPILFSRLWNDSQFCISTASKNGSILWLVRFSIYSEFLSKFGVQNKVSSCSCKCVWNFSSTYLFFN